MRPFSSRAISPGFSSIVISGLPVWLEQRNMGFFVKVLTQLETFERGYKYGNGRVAHNGSTGDNMSTAHFAPIITDGAVAMHQRRALHIPAQGSVAKDHVGSSRVNGFGIGNQCLAVRVGRCHAVMQR